jgi:metal-responsive CopG/Arc/MetJ family transcriptional regulator
MATMSISIDEELKKQIEQFSTEDGVSKSVMVSLLLKQAAFERQWAELQEVFLAKARALGVDSMSEGELEEFLG